MRLVIFICLSSCLLISCNISLSPQAQLKNLQATPNMDPAVKKILAETNIFSQGNWPDKRWWLVFHSPELNNLIEEALINNPSLQEIKSRITTAKEEAIVTRSLLFPLVFFDASMLRQYLSKNGLYRAFNHKLARNATLIDLTLSFTYEFDFWGKNRNLFHAAIGEALATEAEAAEVALITTTALTQVYAAYKTNLVRKQLYEQLVRVRSHLANLQNLVSTKGLASNLPRFSANENLFEAKQLLSSINNELITNKHLINILAGRNPDTPLQFSSSLPSLPRSLVIPKTLSIDLIARRPDLMAQIWRAKALAYRTGAAKAEFYPDFNISGFIGLESTKWRKFLDITSGKAGITPAVHLPIFTAGAIAANVRATKAEFDAAIYAYNDLLLRSTQEVLDVLAFAQDVYEQKKEQVEIVNYAQQRYNLTYLRQQKGLDSDFELYIIEEEVIQRKLINVTLLYNQYLAAVKLIKALGGGYCQTVVPLAKKT
ncbi:efflux transporter outer membrane subunit [Legionella micdadei]|uniref:Efflux transporter, outer membrane factor (OMF) lipoprotein, NodT family n=1 Tax=Legionella micdadei TaxID=451 RepID=A0A098GCI6_LEGMI|nr:efflux transporter outer membrane subunit [Legionella micdadei]ARG98146.1 RND transporter [Legionella micdadei]ARH00942.1 RND transporter [Legionella micdadei]KTD29919.1 outer membrane efflux lipoprotein [Legionella micdadei]NSL19508.1 efflux transporter outer membrane subunit [Legionella micdadei]CEG60199.1 RND efflux system NodT family protein [Legionella micdadei]